MKKILIVLVMACLVAMGTSCQKAYDIENFESFNRYETITFNGCEYYMFGCHGYLLITHKGNCSYCAERAKIERDKTNAKLDSVLNVLTKKYK